MRLVAAQVNPQTAGIFPSARPAEGAAESPAANIQRVNLRDQVLDHMWAALMSGDLRPGEIYSVSALAAQFGVSSSPVREAVLTLANDGLMTAVRNRGFRVVPLTDADLDEVHQIRELLEVPAMGMLARRGARLALDESYRELERNERAADNGDVRDFLESDWHLHMGLLELLGNRRLREYVGTLRRRTRLYGLAPLAERRQLSGFAAEHRQLIEAIGAGKVQEAESLMRSHLAHIRAEWRAPAPGT